MQHFDTLDTGHYYHIYNHGVGGRDLFIDPDNYDYFLKLYDKYVSPVAETYAWVLMKNHFHVLVRVKEGDVAVNTVITPDRVLNPVGGNKRNDDGEILNPSLQFSRLFNAYAQAFNKWSGQRGSLFERPFKRKRIDHPDYLRNVVAYIHHNPVHHGFCRHPGEYQWSSYATCLSDKPTKLFRDAMMAWFDDRAAFMVWHATHDWEQDWHLFEQVD